MDIQINFQEICDELSMQIAQLTKENAILRNALKQMEAQVEEQPNGPSGE